MVRRKPVMLHYGQVHHSHKAMAESVDAELIQVDAGSPISRIMSAKKLDLGNRPVITEGGIPLFQAAWMDIFGHCGPIIHLAADEALMNIFNSLDHYTTKDRLAHAWAHRHIDAVFAVSPRLAAEARVFGTEHIRVIHPFPDSWKWDNLIKNNPDLTSNRILAVGSNRPKNNFGILNKVGKYCEEDIIFDLVGPETDELRRTEHVNPHGFVNQEEFLKLFSETKASILPAVSQPFPVSTLESMIAGLPPFVTDETGTSPFIGKIHPKLVQTNSAKSFANAIDWYSNLESDKRQRISDRARQMGEFFDRDTGKEMFSEAYAQAMEDILE
jgi:glycosyltransferase involved in cell wall biosynthesis